MRVAAPWDRAMVDAVLATLAEVRTIRADVPPIEEAHTLRGWQVVAEDPEPFLSLKRVDRAWLEAT